MMMDIKINSDINRWMNTRGLSQSYYDTQQRFHEILDTKMHIRVPEIPMDFSMPSFGMHNQGVARAQNRKTQGSELSHLNSTSSEHGFRTGGSVLSIVNTGNVTQKSMMSVSEIDEKLKGTRLEGLGGSFKQAEEKYGVNAMFLLGLAIHESDFGNSKIARDKNNLFGFKAYDRSPYRSAQSFSSLKEGIDTVARYLSENYLRKDGKYFNGLSIRDIGKKYATDPRWAQGIERRIKSLLGL